MKENKFVILNIPEYQKYRISVGFYFFYRHYRIILYETWNTQHYIILSVHIWALFYNIVRTRKSLVKQS